MTDISDKPKCEMSIKTPLFQLIFPPEAWVPIANSHKASAGTFHQLLPFTERSLHVFLPSST